MNKMTTSIDKILINELEKLNSIKEQKEFLENFRKHLAAKREEKLLEISMGTVFISTIDFFLKEIASTEQKKSDIELLNRVLVLYRDNDCEIQKLYEEVFDLVTKPEIKDNE